MPTLPSCPTETTAIGSLVITSSLSFLFVISFALSVNVLEVTLRYNTVLAPSVTEYRKIPEALVLACSSTSLASMFAALNSTVVIVTR